MMGQSGGGAPGGCRREMQQRRLGGGSAGGCSVTVAWVRRERDDRDVIGKH